MDTTKGKDILYYTDNIDPIKVAYLNPQIRAGIYYKFLKRSHQVNLTLNFGNYPIMRGDFAFHNIDPLFNYGRMEYRNIYGAIESRFGLFKKYVLM